MTYDTETRAMENAMAGDPVWDEEHTHLVDPADVSTVLRLGGLGSLSSVENYAQPSTVLPASTSALPQSLQA